jgi:uncharacterized protein YciI
MIRCALPAALLTAAACLLVMPVVAQPPASGPVAFAADPVPVASRKLFAVALRSGPAWKRGRSFAEQGLGSHLDYWMAQFRSGFVVTAGPIGNDSGLVLLVAGDLEQARTIMRADPAVRTGIFLGEVQSYALPMVNTEVLPKRP